MKKSKKSYADLAKAIIAKYKNRLGDDLNQFDQLALESLNRELQALAERQENQKALEQQAQTQMAYGGPLLPFQQNAGGYGDSVPSSLNFSYVNQITGEPSTTNYTPMQDYGTATPMSAPLTKSAPRRQTKEDIEAYRQQIAEGVKRAEKAQKSYGGSDRHIHVGVRGKNGAPDNVWFTIGTDGIRFKEYGGSLPQMTRGGIPQGPVPYSPDYLDFVNRSSEWDDYNRTPGNKADYFNYKYHTDADMRALNEDPYLSYRPLSQHVVDRTIDKIPYKKATEVTAQVPSFMEENPVNYAYTVPSSNKVSTLNNDKKESWFKSVPTEAWVGMGAQALGTLGSALLTKKPKDVKLRQMEMPEFNEIDNTQAIRDAQLAYADSERSLRSASPSMYYAGMSKLAADKARAISGIREQTDNANTQARNAYEMSKAQMVNQYNAQQGAMDQYNQQNQMQYNDRMSNVPAALAGVVAGGMKDVMAYKNQQATYPWLNSTNYGVVQDSSGQPAKLYMSGGNSGKGKYYDRGDNTWYYFKNGDPTNKIDKTEYNSLN